MAKFAIFFRFKGEAIKGLIDHPSDRAAVVAKLCEGAGGRMDAYYLMFGDWDGFVIAEMPNSRAAAATSLAVSSTGAFAQLQTHELMESSELAGVLATAASLAYTPPGSWASFAWRPKLGRQETGFDVVNEVHGWRRSRGHGNR